MTRVLGSPPADRGYRGHRSGGRSSEGCTQGVSAAAEKHLLEAGGTRNWSGQGL